MRPRVAWMNDTDDAILEYLGQLKIDGGQYIAQSPTAVWLNLARELEIIDKAQSTVARRMQKLWRADLLVRVDEKRAYYRITPKGIEYLAGELDHDDLPDPDE